MSHKLAGVLIVILVIAGSLILALGAVLWTASLMESLFYYRSPLSENPPQPGSGSGVRTTRRLVFILVDALREDTALDARVMPYLAQLRQRGATATMHSRPPSYSQPAYATLLVGAWPDLNDGPAANLEYEDIPTFTQDNLFSAAHRVGLKTALSGYNWFQRLVPQEAVDISYYTEGEDRLADEQVVAAAIPWLQTDAYQLILIHLDQVDYAGHHEGGPRDPRWNEAARRADDLIRQIAGYLDLSQDTILVLSDHGQIDAGGHGGDEAVALTEPFVLAGAGIVPGEYGAIGMVDVAPTLAALLGANLPATSQGRPLTEMLELLPEQADAVHQRSIVQQEQLLEKYTQAIGQPFELPLESSVAAYQQALSDARSARLLRERLGRIFLALVFLVLPLYWLIRVDKKVIWLAAGALIYTLAFHLLYAVVGGKTYSLSWVSSPEELMSFLFGITMLALAVGWIFVLLGLKLYRLAPSTAAGFVIGLITLTIYLLAVPVLCSFALNGAVVTWTLPHLRSTYLAFLSLIQIAFISIFGLLLAGVTAVVAWSAGRFLKRDLEYLQPG
jgi:hypothetical protein